ncbi:MAG TPA: hypothetical protein PKY88_11220 [Anaerohalosphaeraceae bacterium]|nr:hypothetical protein [Anaerohalosphaeraceae bacterium]
MKKYLVVVAALILAAWGCSKKESPSAPKPTGSAAQPASSSAGTVAGIDLSSSIEQLKESAAKMDLASLEKTAQKYVDEITAKQAQLEKLMEKFAAIPLAQKAGSEAQAIQKDILDLTNAVSDLTSRLNVYVQYIAEKGGDVSKFKVGEK